MNTVSRKRLLWAVTILAFGALFVITARLHTMQLQVVSTSDLLWHLQMAQQGMIYSLTSYLMLAAYHLGGYGGIGVALAAVRVGTIVLFAWGLRPSLRKASWPACLLLSLAANLAQAVWIPHGGDGYVGTVTGTIYHNTTYIALAPFALVAMLAFYRAWGDRTNGLCWRTWWIYTVFLALATAFKASFVLAFAPALLLLLVADLIRTRGKNLLREIWMGCSVLPSIALALLESTVLFTGEGSGLTLAFLVDFDPQKMSWGLYNTASIISLLRSFVFVAAVCVLLRRSAWKSFRYRFSLLTFGVALAEALLLVEEGARVYDANVWWGAFICFWLFLLESVAAWCRAWQSRRQNEGPQESLWAVRICTALFLWHVATGIVYLAQQYQNNLTLLQNLLAG